MRSRGLLLIGIVLAGCSAPPEEATSPVPRSPVLFDDGPRDRPESVQVSQSGAGAYEAGLTAFRGDFAVAWHDTRDGDSDIYFRLIGSDGQPLGPEHRVTDNASLAYEADIQAAGNNLAIAWYERTGGDYEAFAASYNAHGSEAWRRPLSPPGKNGRIPMIRTRFGNVYAAWLEDTAGEFWEIRGGWWDTNGNPIGEVHTLAAAGETTWNINGRIAPDGSVWIVYDTNVYTRAEELYLVRVDTEGAPLGDPVRLTDDDGVASRYPDIAFTRNLAALAWFDRKDGNDEIYVYTGRIEPLARLVPTSYFSVDQTAVRITDTPGNSIGAYLEWNDLRLGVAWSDNTAGQHDVFYQSFDPAGDPVESLRRITDNATESLIPSIQVWEDGFAMAWNEYKPAPDGRHESPDARSEVFFARVP